MAALVFRIKACNCQSSATSFTVFQNPWWLGNLHELHNRELHSPLSSMYANNRQMSQHHPNKHCFPWLLSVLLRFSERSSTESRNTRSRIFVSSSGSFSVTYSNITHVLAVKDNVCLDKILQLLFYKLRFYKHYTFCFSDTQLHINSFVAESLKLVITTQIYPLPKQYENLVSKHKQY